MNMRPSWKRTSEEQYIHDQRQLGQEIRHLRHSSTHPFQAVTYKHTSIPGRITTKLHIHSILYNQPHRLRSHSSAAPLIRHIRSLSGLSKGTVSCNPGGTFSNRIPSNSTGKHQQTPNPLHSSGPDLEKH